MHNSFQPRGQIFVKSYEFLSFAKTICKKLVKIYVKSCEILQKYMSATDALKTTSKRVIQKTAETATDMIANKIAEKIHNKIIQKQLQMSMIKKHLKKDIYLQ